MADTSVRLSWVLARAALPASLEGPGVIPIAECLPITVPAREWTGRGWLFYWAIHHQPGTVTIVAVPVSAS